jgi:SAM-dependent methyltransferase
VSDDPYVARLHAHYAPLLRDHGDSHRALDWGSERSQQLRFRILTQAIDLPSRSVLDVGCGMGHLTDALDASGHTGAYLGVDALAAMVDAARARRPDRRFEQLTGGVEPLPPADVVLGSGLFTFADQASLEATIRAMFAACRISTAVNALSTWGDAPEPGEFAVDPAALFAFGRTLTPWVTVRHDYLPHDCTLILYREPQG